MFKDRLREARLRAGFTQSQLAAQVGIASSTLNGYERGNSEPDLAKIGKIISVLGIDANYLWQDEAPDAHPSVETQNAIDVRHGLGSRIREIRKRTGLSQKDLAAQIGVSNARLSNWENGINRPNAEYLLSLCQALDVSLESLFGEVLSMPTEKPRVTFALDEDVLERLNEYRFQHRYKNQSQAILALIDLGLKKNNTHAEKQMEESSVRMAESSMDFLARLNELARKKGFENTSQLAKASGVPYTTLDNFYRNGYENAKLSTLKKLASCLECSLEYLVNGDNDFSRAEDLSRQMNELSARAAALPATLSEGLDDLSKRVSHSDASSIEAADFAARFQLLDAHGKRVVEAVLELELERCADQH